MSETDALPGSLVVELTVWGEARGQGPDEWAAVIWVIRNRASRPSWWGRTMREVCLKRSQFSCWNERDPNRAKMLALPFGDPILVKIRAVLEQVMMGAIPDPTDGATHYAVTGLNPAWAEGKEPCFATAAHEYWNDIA